MTGQFLASAFCIVGGIICLSFFGYGLRSGKITDGGMKANWYSRRDDKVFYWFIMTGYLVGGLFFMVMGIGFGLHDPNGESCVINCLGDK